MAREYVGIDITIRYEPRRCIHAEECIHGLASVFQKDRRPWIDADGAEADQIAAVIEKCPTGALAYERHDGGPAEAPGDEVRFEVAPNGPVYVAGPFELTDHQGRAIDTPPRAALCRCGHSKIKPFCDNTHLEVGFEAP